MLPEDFDLLSEITDVETMAVKHSIREIDHLNRRCGIGRWRKRKGVATIRYKKSGRVVRAEIHWYDTASVQSNGK